jgi:hypothetical protein
VRKDQDVLKTAKVLEKMGNHITEVYNAAGFLRVYVNGEEKTLWQMVWMCRNKRR